MAASSLILVANPGSASRKYGLYEGDAERAQLHFEWQDGRVICSLQQANSTRMIDISLSDLHGAPAQATSIMRTQGILLESESIAAIGLRIVAPSGYFLEDRLIDDDVTSRLEALLPRAPLHIQTSLDELRLLRQQFSTTPIVGVSDSAFHITKPDYAWNYGIDLHHADFFEIKRFGYHGLSVASIVHTLRLAEKLPARLIVCHLGSGASVTAVYGGKSIDTTMGYSPLEGLVMSTRSGSIDPAAVRVLKEVLQLDDHGIEEYLNKRSGLLGLGGSDDIRELLAREAGGDHRAQLALRTYIFAIQKAIGQMAATIGGIDMLVFTGAVGERSAIIRERVTARLHYLDFLIDSAANAACLEPKQPEIISRLAHSRPIYVISSSEGSQIAARTGRLISPRAPETRA